MATALEDEPALAFPRLLTPPAAEARRTQVLHRDLSSSVVKVRDAIVAVAAGSVVTVLTLFIGASGTTSRLSSYFAEMAPTLGHGREIVNVILVDFRGLDTLGETTVLVTVAVGVRALLLIGRERRS